MKSPTTLLDVAEAAGVSKSTAANVFNHPERVRPEVRTRVEDAARSLGFAGPDARGRLLSSGKANVIGIVSSGQGISWVFDNAYMRTFMAAVAAECEHTHASLQIIDGYGDAGRETIRRTIVDGLILHTRDQLQAVDPALRRKLPIVVMDRVPDPDVSSVAIDDRGGARELTRHLLSLGHRRFIVAPLSRGSIAPILHQPTGGPRRLVSADAVDLERVAGVGDALAEAGLSINDMPLVEACGSELERKLFGSGAALALDHLDGATAIIALSGEMALSLLAEAKARGIAVPRDLSVAGFDDPPEAALAAPPLTTITAPVAETGRRAAQLLFAGGPPQHLELPVKLMVRASTATPRP